ncbi:hypothetical protein DFJ77DRAFT_369125 [Powellomyces hirtus]|nr:hypothetical protein DFJ77DRAFT_369125 [Powellomyces hirtus]
MTNPDLLQLLNRSLDQTTPGPEHLELIRSILQEQRKTTEAELAARQEETKLKELELAILREKNLLLSNSSAASSPALNSSNEPIPPPPPSLPINQLEGMAQMTQGVADLAFNTRPDSAGAPQHQQNLQPDFLQQLYPLDPTTPSLHRQPEFVSQAYQVPAVQNVLGLATPPPSSPWDLSSVMQSAEQSDSLADYDSIVWDALARNPTPKYQPETLDDEPAFEFNLYGHDYGLGLLNALISTDESDRTIAAPASPPLSDAHTLSSEPRAIAPTNRTASLRASRRNAKEVSVSCRLCLAPVALCRLHGEKEEAVRYIPDFTCIKCTPVAAKAPRRKRTTNLDPAKAPVICDICKSVSALGGFRLPYTSSSSSDPQQASSQQHQPWTAPDFAVEFNCCPCRAAFKLCSDCGGGGKYRTGKWRPLELFAAGRATCSLPHVRLSQLQTTASVFHLRHNQHPLPEHLDTDDPPEHPNVRPALSKALRACIWTEFMNFFSLPKPMKSNAAFQKWDKLKHQINYITDMSDEELFGTDIEKDRLPKVTTYELVEWYTENRVLLNFFGVGRRVPTEATRWTHVDIIHRILDDHEYLVAKAAKNGTVAPLRPKWLVGAVFVYTDDCHEDDFSELNFRYIEDVPECPWTQDMMDKRMAFHSDRNLVCVKRHRIVVGDVDEVLAAIHAWEDRRENKAGRSKKRALKE